MRPLLTMSFAVLACSISGCAEDVQVLTGSGGDGGGGGTTTTDVQGGGGSGTTTTASQGAGGSGGTLTTDTLSSGGQGGGGGGRDGIHFARFGLRNGQETVGDFCVAYAKDADNDTYLWHDTGVLAPNGVNPADFDGMEKITAYLPLEGAPVAFGYVYPGKSCTGGLVVQQAEAPADVDHFTILAVPYSFEPIVLWVVGDPVTENEADPKPDGFRIVNAALSSYPIEAASSTGGDPPVPHGTFQFANSPTEYFQQAFDHLWTLDVTEFGGAGAETSVTFDFTSIDLLSVRPRRTIFVSGLFPGATALACADTMDTQPGDPKSSSCFLFDAAP